MYTGIDIGGTNAMAGYTAGELKALSDICLEAPERETFKVQVYHLPIYHSICADAENIFFGEK